MLEVTTYSSHGTALWYIAEMWLNWSESEEKVVALSIDFFILLSPSHATVVDPSVMLHLWESSYENVYHMKYYR